MTSPVSTRHHQRGAIGVFGVVVLLLAVLFTAVVVDSGRLWAQKRKLQSIADMAAIDAAKEVGGCPAGTTAVMKTRVANAAQASALSNGYVGSLLSTPNAVDVGMTQPDMTTGVRSFSASSAQRQSVWVRATREVPASLFAGGLFTGNIVITADAVAPSRSSYASFMVGSTAATLNTSDSNLLNALLGKVLGTTLTLGLASYQGIANSQLTLLNLVQARGISVGSVNDLLNLNLSLKDFMQLLAVAAGQSGATSNAQVVADLANLATKTVNTTNIKIGDVLKVVNPDPNAVLGAGINVLQLLNTAVLVANGNNAIGLPLGISIPNLTSIDIKAFVVQPPQLVIGPAAFTGGPACTVARTAQVRVETSVNQPGILGLIAAIDLKLVVEVAPGRAELMGITTQSNGQTNVRIDAYPGLASIRLTNNAVSGPAELRVVGPLAYAELGLNAPITQPAPNTMTFNLSHPVSNSLPVSANSYGSAGQSMAGLATGANLNINVCVAGICLGNVVNAILTPTINNIVLPLLAGVTANVVDPLLKMLGVNIAGVTVILTDVKSGTSRTLVR